MTDPTIMDTEPPDRGSPNTVTPTLLATSFGFDAMFAEIIVLKKRFFFKTA